jgi:hypothetical protein
LARRIDAHADATDSLIEGAGRGMMTTHTFELRQRVKTFWGDRHGQPARVIDIRSEPNGRLTA